MRSNALTAPGGGRWGRGRGEMSGEDEREKRDSIMLCITHHLPRLKVYVCVCYFKFANVYTVYANVLNGNLLLNPL